MSAFGELITNLTDLDVSTDQELRQLQTPNSGSACRRPAHSRNSDRRSMSLRSQAAPASTSFIVREIFRASFPNLPILIPMHG